MILFILGFITIAITGDIDSEIWLLRESKSTSIKPFLKTLIIFEENVTVTDFYKNNAFEARYHDEYLSMYLTVWTLIKVNLAASINVAKLQMNEIIPL